MSTETSSNRFERHPKLALFFLSLLLIGLLYLVFVPKWFSSPYTEYSNQSLKTILTQYFFGQVIDHNVHRFIKLREHAPNPIRKERPSRSYVSNLPGQLERRYYDFTIEHEGFVAPSAVHANPDVKIVFLGGSTTECMYLDPEQRFPFIVGRQLEQNLQQKVNTYNGGVSANESMHSINILLNKVIPMQPNIVVMMHNINDLVMLRLAGHYHYSNSSLSHVQTAKNVFTPVVYPKPLPAVDEAKISEQFKRNLKLFVKICQIHQMQPVLMTQANQVENDDLYHTFNQIIRDTAKEENILLIDLANHIPKNTEYMYDHYHFTAKGSLEAAKTIVKNLTDSLKKPG